MIGDAELHRGRDAQGLMNAAQIVTGDVERRAASGLPFTAQCFAATPNLHCSPNAIETAHG